MHTLQISAVLALSILLCLNTIHAGVFTNIARSPGKYDDGSETIDPKDSSAESNNWAQNTNRPGKRDQTTKETSADSWSGTQATPEPHQASSDGWLALFFLRWGPPMFNPH